MTDPFVYSLTRAASKPLAAWITDNTARVTGVVTAATAAPVNVARVREERDEVQPLAFGSPAALKDDGLTDAERKRALAWLKRRADASEGVFDGQEAHLAISLLPGWSSTVEATTRAVPFSDTTKNASFPKALVAAGFVYLPASKHSEPSLETYKTGQSNIEGVRLIKRGWNDYLAVTPEIAATFTIYDPTRTKVKNLPAGRWASSMEPTVDGDVILHAPVLVLAEEGGLSVTNPQGQTASVRGNSAWRTLYGERDASFRRVGGMGLVQAAKAALAGIEQRVAAHDALVSPGWDKHLCGYCFGYAAVTPSTKHMVDHRHTRPGVGFNVQPCPGRKYAPYKDAPNATRAALEQQEKMLQTTLTYLRSLIEHPNEQTFRVKVEIRDAKGLPVYEIDPDFPKWDRRHKRIKTEYIALRYGHPLYASELRAEIQYTRADARNIRDSIPFLRAAVRSWRPGLDGVDALRTISADVRENDDTPALPADLFA